MSLETNLANAFTRVGTESKALRTLVNGNQPSLAALNTTAKTNLVAAINEVLTLIGGAGASIDDDTTTTATVWSSTKTNDEITAAVDALVDAAPGALDTLAELAAALGDDPNFATTITNGLADKAPKADPTFTGTVTVPDNSFTIAKTSGLQTALNAKISALSPQPGADQIVFWDNSVSGYAGLTMTGLTITGNTLAVVQATETVAGKIELATLAEVATGTDTTRAVTPAGVAQQIATRAPVTHTHTASQITDFAAATVAAVPVATETVQGKVELATTAEIVAGADTSRAITPAGLRAVMGNPEENLVTVFEAALV